MTTNLKVGDYFPDITLPDELGIARKISSFTRPGQLDQHLGFNDGYPLILIFLRGFFCPRDQEQLRQLVPFQNELNVNFGRLTTISVDPPLVNAAFRAGLGAQWHFLSDEDRQVIKSLDMLDETEGEYAYRSQPYTFILRPDLRIHKIYNGWYFVGRPTLEELRHDLRAIMEMRSDYKYETYTTPEVTRIRIPQQEWLHGAPELGINGLEVAQGIVDSFDLRAGNGTIKREGSDDRIFFHFTAIPGQGYRTIKPGTHVHFEIVENPTGLTARNIQTL